MRRIRRSDNYDISVDLKKETFIAPPNAMQRSAIVNKALKEFGSDLDAMHEIAPHFIHGDVANKALDDRTQVHLDEQEIMEDWQIPLMQRMAAIVGNQGGEVLEVGFGRGVSADMIQEYPVDSHTIIECNDSVISGYFDPWKAKYKDERDIILVKGLWQDAIRNLGTFDGIFFHTYPLTMEEYMEYVSESITFAEHFFPYAADHLNEGGVFTYFSNEIDSLSRAHQRALLKHFSAFEIQIVNLQVPENARDTWWANTIAVVKAIK